MTATIHKMPRHGMAGYYALADLPQRESVYKSSIGVGWPDTMDHLLRLYPGQLVLTSGKAGDGKSTFWLNVVCNIAADYNWPTYMYVPENEGHVLAKLQRIWGVRGPWKSFAEEMCYVQSSYGQHYYDEEARFGYQVKDLYWILQRAEQAIERDGVRLVLLDPWNEIERAKPKDQTTTEYIGQCLMHVKQFCRSLDATVVIVNHLTKESIKDGKRGSHSDMEGSLAWANKADNILMVYRMAAGPTEVVSTKVREKGAGLRAQCVFDVDEESEQFSPVSWEKM